MPSNTTLKQKAIDCLTVAAMTIGSPERVAAIEELSQKWSRRAIRKKFDELVDRDYIEPLIGGAACGGLTAKGRAALTQSSDHHAQ